MYEPTVFLFDIDGTILDSRGAGRRAMEAAFAELYPRHADAMRQVKFAGMTDPGIARAALRHAELPEDGEAMEAVVQAYLRRIEAELEVGPASTVYPGAVAAIDAAVERPRSAVGLGTGNHVEGARAKMAAVDLWDRFSFGGYGSDAEDRAQMLAIGRDRGLSQLNVETAHVLVIGDTPRDVAAAHAIGARCLAVTTGWHDAEILSAAGADLVVDRLDAPAALAMIRA